MSTVSKSLASRPWLLLLRVASVAVGLLLWVVLSVYYVPPYFRPISSLKTHPRTSSRVDLPLPARNVQSRQAAQEDRTVTEKASVEAVEKRHPYLVIDIGTADWSDFEGDLQENRNLILLGIEPTQKYFDSMVKKLSSRGSAIKNRFQILQKACAPTKTVTLFTHPLEECNSALPDGSGKLVVHGGSCLGVPAVKEKNIPALGLEGIYEKAVAIAQNYHKGDDYNYELTRPRVRLLKLDVQGFEWQCLSTGSKNLLDLVDNIFVEIQDIEDGSSQLMYKGSLTLAAFERELGRKYSEVGEDFGGTERGPMFTRQYCEVNTPGPVREFNCLYTRRGREPLWTTGRQAHLRKLELRSIRDGVEMNSHPWFPGVQYVGEFVAPGGPGVLYDRLQRLGRS